MTAKTTTTKRRPSRRSRSEFVQRWDAFCAELPELPADAPDRDALAEDVRSAADQLDSIAAPVEELEDETREKLDNILEHFPDGSPVSEILEARADECGRLHDEILGAADDLRTIADDLCDDDAEHDRTIADVTSDAQDIVDTIDFELSD